MNRLLIFHYHGSVGSEVLMAPAYYIEAEYEKVAARIYAGTAPRQEAEIDILDDGVSIFADQGNQTVHPTTGVISILGAGTSATLAAGENSEEAAEDFAEGNIEQGSWITCKLVDAGGGKNFTVQLELSQVSEDDE